MDFSVRFLTTVIWMCTTFQVITAGVSTTHSDAEWDQDSFVTTTQTTLHFIQMGKGLREIPLGSHNLESINFGYNRIPSLGPYVFYYNGYLSLTKIELCQNKIFNVSQNAFKELSQLKMVDLSGNNLTSLEVNTFKSNTKLVKLDLSQNKIGFIPFKLFLNSATLETLVLSSNKVDHIYEATFSKLPKLRNLMLNDNTIFFIDQNAFTHLRCLQYLSLASTGVFRLSENMFRNDSYPKIIDLSDTPLANKFDPPLKKVKNNGVANLLTLDRYF
ncbi:unnamed protein product [Acanthoscelides obtectus]|uniref:Uncharacterized protein n=1 Tax=Acanthoscelides obtectus TaxID=200917 RepID=A0A9P0LX13_ACAOB|nr:unnamed protein product [Acanthoscelides obtectus]CAK1669014.1 Toll-like receptor 7 [Acanthoscelides obtectus]